MGLFFFKKLPVSFSFSAFKASWCSFLCEQPEIIFDCVFGLWCKKSCCFLRPVKTSASFLPFLFRDQTQLREDPNQTLARCNARLPPSAGPQRALGGVWMWRGRWRQTTELSPPTAHVNARARLSLGSSPCLPLLCIYKAPWCAERQKRASSLERQSASRAELLRRRSDSAGVFSQVPRSSSRSCLQRPCSQGWVLNAPCSSSSLW